MQMTKEIETLLILTKTSDKGNEFKTMSQFTSKLFNIINEKLGINSCWIEAFAFAFARTLNSGHIPRNGEEYVIEGDTVLSKRSFAGMSAHNAFAIKIMQPELFIMDDPVSHPSDCLFRMDQFINQLPAELHAENLPKNNIKKKVQSF